MIKDVKIKAYKSIFPPVVLYGVETLFLISREEHRKWLRRISGPKRDEIIGGWGTLHDERPHDLNSSSNIIRTIKSSRMRWSGQVAHMGEKRNACNFLVEKT
jgi:hypothetical protein